MPGNPVNDHPNAMLVKGIHQEHEIERISEAVGRRIESGDLIAPRSGKRMLSEWHELNMGEPVILRILCKFIRDLPIGWGTTCILNDPTP